MKTCIIVPSVRRFEHWRTYAEEFKHMKPDIIVVDEEDGKARKENRGLMGDNAEFYGVRERAEWFKSRDLIDEVIPPRAHAETSFGLLVAYERGGYDMIVFIDDDTFPEKIDFLRTHWKVLNEVGKLEPSISKWINVTRTYYPRGYPYGERFKSTYCSRYELREPGKPVLNQGLWTNIPDMNAIDILMRGGLNGRCYDLPYVKGNFLVGYGNYATVCSMNLSFKPEIIPAFYQLYMSREAPYGVDRYDDIWSGIFLKKILDQLGKSMSYGYPLCLHDKYPRDIFKDIKAEMEGMRINENLWKVVDSIELAESDYLNCYRELAVKLSEKAGMFHLPDYIEFMCEKMVLWTKLIEKLEP
jgi:hypothetical protein